MLDNPEMYNAEELQLSVKLRILQDCLDRHNKQLMKLHKIEQNPLDPSEGLAKLKEALDKERAVIREKLAKKACLKKIETFKNNPADFN